MDNKVYSLDEIRNVVSPIAKHYGVERIYVFGSYARGEATAHSDVDFLLYGFPGHDLIDFGCFYDELQKKLMRNIDVVNVESLRAKKDDKLIKTFIRRIKEDRLLIYEKQ